MQNQSNETPKIIALTVAIILILGFVVFQYLRLTRPPDSPVAGTNDMMGSRPNLPDTTQGQVTLANATSSRQGGVGQMRVFSDILDAEPGTGPTINIPAGPPNAFRQFKPPAPPVIRPGAQASAGNPWTPPDWNKVAQNDPRIKKPPVTPPPPPEPPIDIKLDGVILASPSEAVLTVIDGAGTDKNASTRTLYLRVGDRLPSGKLKIAGITEAGILIDTWKEVWLIGQQRSFGGVKLATIPLPPTTDKARDSKSSILPSGLFGVTPSPTLVP
jgi:hypothetical protein